MTQETTKFKVGDVVRMHAPMNPSIPPGSIGAIRKIYLNGIEGRGGQTLYIDWDVCTHRFISDDDRDSGWYSCQFEEATEAIAERHRTQLADHSSYYAAITEGE